MEQISELLKIFEKYPTPYYFIGAGISRRYLDTPDWETLLKLICQKYSIQFNKLLLESSEKNTKIIDYSFVGTKLREKLTKLKVEKDSDYDFRYRDALKEEVIYLLKDAHKNLKENSEIVFFRKLLKKSSGVITTNYDLLIETLDIDKDFESYIGQKGIIEGNISFSQEIYKIHGCVTDEQSIVITKEDYETFLEKQKYLLGKLIVIFTEYPIIFLGYKISDENIRSILRDLSISLSKEQLEKISQKWIFVERKEGETELILSKREISITDEKNGKFDLIFNCITTDNYKKLYQILDEVNNYIPANKKVIKYIRKIIKKYEFNPTATEGVTFDKNIESIKNLDELKLSIGIIREPFPTPHNVVRDMLFNPNINYSETFKKDYIVKLGRMKYYPRYFLGIEKLNSCDLNITSIKLNGNLKEKELVDFEVNERPIIISNYNKIKEMVSEKKFNEELLTNCYEFLKKIYIKYETEFDIKTLNPNFYNNIKKITCILDILKYKKEKNINYEER